MTPSALFDLKDGELCIATISLGEYEVEWNKRHWCFYFVGAKFPIICAFEKIEEWRPASIKF